LDASENQSEKKKEGRGSSPTKLLDIKRGKKKGAAARNEGKKVLGKE